MPAWNFVGIKDYQVEKALPFKWRSIQTLILKHTELHAKAFKCGNAGKYLYSDSTNNSRVKEANFCRGWVCMTSIATWWETRLIGRQTFTRILVVSCFANRKGILGYVDDVRHLVRILCIYTSQVHISRVIRCSTPKQLLVFWSSKKPQPADFFRSSMIHLILFSAFTVGKPTSKLASMFP